MKSFFERIRPIHAVVAALALAVLVQSVFVYHLATRDQTAAAETNTDWHVASNTHQWAPNNAPLNNPTNGAQPADQWDPFAQMDQMRQHMDAMMQQAFGNMQNMPGPGITFQSPGAGMSMSFGPSIEWTDKGDHYEITVDMPEDDSTEIGAELHGQTLTITGKQSATNGNQQGNASSQVQFSGTYQRSMTLPEPIQEGSMKTEVKDGHYLITVAKAR